MSSACLAPVLFSNVHPSASVKDKAQHEVSQSLPAGMHYQNSDPGGDE